MRWKGNVRDDTPAEVKAFILRWRKVRRSDTQITWVVPPDSEWRLIKAAMKALAGGLKPNTSARCLHRWRHRYEGDRRIEDGVLRNKNYVVEMLRY